MMGRMMGGGGGGGTMRGGSSSGGGGGRGKRSSGGRRGSADGGFDPYYDGGRPLGPVEELYEDIYDDLSGPDDDNVPPILKLFGAVGGGGGGRRSGGRRGGGGGGGSDRPPPGPGAPGRGGGIDRPTSRLNIGIPKRTYLRVTNLNSRYDSYRYSLVEATRGRAAAAAELRARGFEDAFRRAVGVSGGGGTALGGLSPAEGTALLTLERDFLASGAVLVGEAASMTRAITNAAVLMEMEEMGIEAGTLDAIIDAEVIDDGDAAAAAVAVTDAQRDFFGMGSATAAAGHSAGTAKTDKKDDDKGAGRMKIEKKSDIMRAVREVEAINTDILLLELDFVRSVVEVLGPDRADAIRTTIVGNSIGGGAGTLLRTLKERPLASVLSSLHGGTNDDGGGNRRKNLYVTRFPGDVSASQLNELREEVTGILRSALPGDEALLVLQSGGGTVTGCE